MSLVCIHSYIHTVILPPPPPPPFKIAVLFSGRIFKYKEHYQNIMEKIVQNNQCDFFLSHSPELIDENLKDFEEMYKPKIIINKPIKYNADFYGCSFSPHFIVHNIMCMHYNRKRIFEKMLEYILNNDIKYDYIFNMRLDCFNKDYLNINKIVVESKLTKEELEKTVFVPIKANWEGVNDQFAFGKLIPMHIYMSIIDNLNSIMKIKPRSNPEGYMKCHLEQNGINYYSFNYEYYIVR
jgi:hypothetical protein